MKRTMKRQRQGGFLLSKAHQLAGRVFNRLLKEHDITAVNKAQGRIMFVLWRRDGVPIGELAERTGLGKSTLTGMLDRLERSGLVRRAPAPGDRRSVLVFRTEKDRTLEERYVEVSRRMTDVYYRGFSGAEITRFEAALERILANLESEEETP